MFYIFIGEKMKIKFILNNYLIETESHPAKSLLDFLRKEQKLTGPKEVCKEGDCGACTVLLGEIINGSLSYKSVASCIFPMGKVNGKHVVTIEGLNEPKLNFIQKHFAEEGAAQCGFCTPGYISSLTGYFLTNSQYTETTATMAISGNICRCTGYGSIKRAVKNMVSELSSSKTDFDERINFLVERNVIPSYFKNIKERLLELETAKTGTPRNAKIIGGGSDLLVQMPEKLMESEVAILERAESELITENETAIILDANSTFTDFAESELIKKYLGNFDAFAKLIASPLIRNAATLGGNIVNASPIGDFSIILLALNAKLEIVSNNETREVKLENFYRGYKQLNLNDGEIVRKIIIPKPAENSKFNFEKVSKRMHLDIASVNSAVIVLLSENKAVESVRISAGGVAPIPTYLRKTSEYLIGKALINETLAEAIKIADDEISPISDIRGSAEYKRKLLKRLILAHFAVLYPELISAGELI